MQGNEFEAKVFVAATDTTRDPEILIGNYTTRQMPTVPALMK